MAAEKTKPGVTKKEGEITESGLVIQNINIRPVQRSKEDIQTWRSKHQQAEMINSQRVSLYDLYDDVLLDGYLQRMVQKRILGVTKHKLQYVDANGVEIEGADTLIDSLQFRYMRECIQAQKAWGITVIELFNEDGKLKVFDVPKKHILPKEGKIIYEQFGIDGIAYTEPPYNKTVFQIGRHNDLGYLLQAGAYAIYKRGDIADWANYAQIFGMPFREARYDGFNEVVRLQLEQALEKAASAAWAVLPKDAEFTLHEAKGTSGSNELYDSLRKAMNEEMMVLILGATESTSSSKSSGYAQSQTHKQTVDELAQDDKVKEICIINETVLPILINLGLLPPGGTITNEDPVDLDTAERKIKIAQAVKLMGFPLDADDIYETSGLKKPDDYDAQVAKMEADKQAEQQQQPPAPKGGQAKPPLKKDKNTPSGDGGKKLGAWDEFRLMMADFFGQAHQS